MIVNIRGLNFNTPDSLVMNYLGKFGSIKSNKVVYDTDKEGPFEGIRNGTRKYMIDFTGGRNMGTFHIIDGAYVTIHSSGIKRTCARCHQSSINCVGGSFAKQCEENGGPKIKLVDHMSCLLYTSDAADE